MTERRLARLAVDPGAVCENWRLLGKVSPSGEAAAVIKADAYGLGVDRIAPSLMAAGCQLFFVATVGEGVRLRELLGAQPAIYVLNGVYGPDLATLSAHNLVPVLNSLDQLRVWRDNGRPSFALHIDTGMNRLGLAMTELPTVRDIIGADRPYLVMSHLACASEPDHPMNAIQCGRFAHVKTQIPAWDFSLAASAGMLLGPEFSTGVSRPGIALYGSWASSAKTARGLQVSARAFAPILQLRDIAAGDTVGYGATFTAKKTMRLATIGAGYADGVPRALSGKGFAAIEGAVCPYVGRVSMDLIVIDVTGVTGASLGADVELLGDYIRLDDLAAAADMIPYEILTGFGAAMRRTAA